MKDYIDLKSELLTQNYTKIRKFSESQYYVVNCQDSTDMAEIFFQNGPIKVSGVNGIFDEDLLAIVIDRLETFQKGKLPCEENKMAIIKLKESLMWLRKRTNDRKMRNVEGTYQL